MVPPAVQPSAPPFTPPQPLRPAVPPVERERSRKPGRPASGAAKLVAGRVAVLGGWMRTQSPKRVGAAAAGLVFLGLVIWWAAFSLGGGTKPTAEHSTPATGAASSSAPASRGPLPLEGVNPLEFQLGDCFKDFDPNSTQATVVACDTGHSAQLVAIDRYQASDAYPGRDPLKQKALDACNSAPITKKPADYILSYKLAYPSSSSWDKGDRRVDCYAVADTGNVILESLLPQT